MHLDLASILNLVSTAAIVGALVFTALQVRAASNARRDQAAVVIIQTTQDSSWTQALNLVFVCGWFGIAGGLRRRLHARATAPGGNEW